MSNIVVNKPQELLTKEQLSKKLKVSQKTIENWTRDGFIPAIKIGVTTIRFDWDAVLTAIQNNKSNN